MTDISTTPTTETRVVTLAVTGAPDLPLGHSGRSIVPSTVEIDYRWESAAKRSPCWYLPGQSTVKVTGRYRLKSGAVGDGTASREFYGGVTTARPEWVQEIVAAHQPSGWVEDTYTGTLPAPLLSESQRVFLSFALDLAFDRMVSEDGFTTEDEAALESLRALAAAPEPLCGCGHRRGQHVPRPGDWPLCTACPQDRNNTGYHRYTPTAAPATEGGAR